MTTLSRSPIANFKQSLARRRANAFAAVPKNVMLVFCLAITLFLTYFVHSTIDQDRRARFNHEIRQILSDLNSRLYDSTNTLQHTRGLFVLHPGTTHEQFRAFVSTLEIDKLHPGLLGLGFVPVIEGKDVPKFIDEMRQSGAPDYQVWPLEPRRKLYSVLKFIEPLTDTNRHALGFDLMSESVRNEAMERARDTGRVTISRRVRLIQQPPDAKPDGFVLFMPIYKGGVVPATEAGRRRNLVGFVTGPLRAKAFFSSVFKPVADSGLLGVEIYERSDLSEDSLLFASKATEARLERGEALQSTSTIDAIGTPWTLKFRTGPALNGSTNQVAWYVLASGLLVSLVLHRRWSDYNKYSRQLQASENRLKIVTDRIPALIALIGLDGRYRFANAAHSEWFGLDSKTMVGRQLNEILQSESDTGAREQFAKAMRGERVSFEMKLKHQRLGFRQVKVDCIPHRSDENEPDCFIALATDVSELMRLVEALRQSESRQRLAAREKEALYKRAQSLNRAKDDFLAMLSHELRTPLTVILGHAELLKEATSKNDELRESIESILRNAKAQNQIVNDLIDVSSIITGKISLHVESLDIGRVVHSVVEGAKLPAQRKGIDLTYEIEEGSSAIRGDSVRLQQVLMNLLVNACKFTPSGGWIRVTSRTVDGFYEISIRDSGQGIDPDFLTHVFDRFQQEDNTMTRRHGGLGLGLSIARNLVQAHHGTIEARSAGRGLGAEFIVRLPSVPKLVRNSDEARPRMHRPERAALDSKRVLIVDDEPDARRLIARYLERSGAQVRAAGSAKEALSALKEFSPELIISDIGMPDEDGYSLIRKIRSEEHLHHRRETPAIALTAYAREEDRVRALQAGYHAHLSKPIGSQSLTDAALAVLQA